MRMSAALRGTRGPTLKIEPSPAGLQTSGRVAIGIFANDLKGGVCKEALPAPFRARPMGRYRSSLTPAHGPSLGSFAASCQAFDLASGQRMPSSSPAYFSLGNWGSRTP